MKYVVQYTLPYKHRVMVGIKADSSNEAIRKAEALHDQGDLMQDSAEVPLLLDDCEGDDSPLHYTVKQELAEDEPWPEPYGNVNTRYQNKAALQVGKLLINAYRRGEAQGGSIDWDELDLAYQAALDAACNNEDPPLMKVGNSPGR
jgi:hypothetical protein